MYLCVLKVGNNNAGKQEQKNKPNQVGNYENTFRYQNNKITVMRIFVLVYRVRRIKERIYIIKMKFSMILKFKKKLAIYDKIFT